MLSNTTLGKYEVHEVLGHGSMGTVYRGYDPFAAREVAIKVANRDSSAARAPGVNPRKLFFNEANVAARLKHPNIVAVYDASVEGDDWYIVMEYVPGGRTLQAHARPDSLLSLENVVRAMFKCAVAIDHAHRRGVIHRDLKPRNILLTDTGEIKIADFGVAMITRFDATETQIRGYVGSPLYMAPEQIRDENIAAQSDLFSLGLVMYELLTGRNPFTADSLPSIIHNICHQPHAPLGELRTDAPRILEHIVDRTLKKKTAQRYRSGMDLAGDLSLVFDELALPRTRISAREQFDRVKHLRFFAEFTDTELWEVINACHWHEFPAAAPIITEGEMDDSFYVIASGEVVVEKSGSPVDYLAAGDCFGEMGFIAGRQRSASIRAHSEVAVMQVRASLIERASLPCQLRFHKRFLHTLVERLSLATSRMLRAGA